MRGAIVLTLVFAACKGGGDSDSGLSAVAPLLGILVSPDRPIVPAGGTVQLEATGLRDDRSSVDLTTVVDWQVQDAGVVAVSEGLDEEGLLRAVSVGETEVWAEAEGVTSVRVKVRVSEANVLGLTVAPDAIAIAKGATVQLAAQAVWSDGTRGEATTQVQWVTDDGAVAQIATGGVLTAAGVGETAIHAEWDALVSKPVPVTVTSGGGRPDLRVSEVIAEAGGGYATLTVTVENIGSTGASDFFVDLFVDREPAPGTYGDDFDVVEYVGPGGVATVSFFVEADLGTPIWVVVDSDGDVDESNEDNNTFATEVSAHSGGVGPNLYVDWFDYLIDGDSIYYAVDVYNGGTEDAGPFYVDVYVNQGSEPGFPSDGDVYVYVPGLAAGDIEFADFLLENWRCGVCTSWVLVDSYDEVLESDETDNAGGPLDVDGPPLDTGF